MINYKTKQEIEIMRQGGEKLKNAVSKLIPFIRVGLTTEEIDKEAEHLLKREGVESSFKRVEGYFWTTCITLNDQVVHTPPSKRIIKSGDVITVDIGAYYKGFHTDYSTTFVIGEIADNSTKNFLSVGKKTLYKAIEKAKIGNRIGNISSTIQNEINKNGYFVMKQLTGHGVGRDLHEDPFIPGYLERPINKTPMLKDGLVIAIEVIYSLSTEEIKTEPGNKWSIVTADGSISACFEHTVAIIEETTVILT